MLREIETESAQKEDEVVEVEEAEGQRASVRAS
jgi:hypothetical protein